MIRVNIKEIATHLSLTIRALVIERAQSDVVKLVVIANFSAIFRTTIGKFLKAILNDSYRASASASASAAAATVPLLNFKLHFYFLQCCLK